jgi:hypothetical protein
MVKANALFHDRRANPDGESFNNIDVIDDPNYRIVLHCAKKKPQFLLACLFTFGVRVGFSER